jgi:Cu+-exporting ATPase
MWVQPDTARGGSVVHAGEVVSFCGPRCREKFVADPERYLQPASAAPAAAAQPAARTEYVCPMHPEVVRDAPGSCPKCGMALEPRVLSLDSEPNPELVDMQRRFWVSLAFTLPTLALAMGDMLPGAPRVLSPRALVWAQLLLSTPVVVWGALPFFQRGVASIANRHLNMFTLIALGTFAAYAFSLVATFFPGVLPQAMSHSGAPPVYYESAAVITTLVLLGQVLELRARSATSGAIRALLSLSPKTARVLRDGTEEDVPLERVSAGDRLRVRPGEHVPVDGRVLEGHGVLDESSLTGEPVPVDKGPGASVTGGTLNTTGGFVMRAERVGNDTVLARIVALVGEAQRSRAPIQRLADVVSAWFVPAVIAVALGSFFVWMWVGPEPHLAHALTNAVAVLIIACPCALGLATPMSIMVGTGRGASAGVLIKNAEALELFEKVDTLVLDKTGTLTLGRPELARVVVAPGFEENDVLAAAAALEISSEHPQSTAIVRGARERGLALPAASDFRSLTGRGVTGRVGGRRLDIGNAALLGEAGADLSALAAESQSLRAGGHTVVSLAIDGKLAALFALADPIAPGVPSALEALRESGLRIVMLSGDHEATARAVARELGIDEVRAELSPEQKHGVIRQLREAGRVVAMAGDGTNDAPALAAAHVGIALGTGTDVAIQSAAITLIQADLRALVRARRLSAGVMRNIRQNLFLAFIYNAIGVPLAAGVAYPLFGLLLSPMFASAAMALSSVSVISNALRLRRTAL